MQSTAEVIQIDETKEVALLETAITEYKIPDVTLKALAIFKEAEYLECVDTESRKIIGRHRADIKSLRPKINRARIDKNKEFEEKNNAAAALIEDALDKSYAVFDQKIKAYDAKAEEKRLAKAKIESDRVGKIQWYMDGLIADCEPLEYGLSCEKIAGEIRFLESIEISAVDFQEAFDDAERIVIKAIQEARVALENRKRFEAEQKIAAQIKADNEAKAKKLAEEKAELEKKAKEEAYKRRKEDERLKAEREALEKEKAEIAAAKQVDKDRSYAIAWKRARMDHYDFLYPEASEMSFNFDLALEEERNNRLRADAERAKLIEYDKKILFANLASIEAFISACDPLKNCYNTNEVAQIELDVIVKVKAAIEVAEKAGKELV